LVGATHLKDHEHIPHFSDEKGSATTSQINPDSLPHYATANQPI
jgi:hypothetical protein